MFVSSAKTELLEPKFPFGLGRELVSDVFSFLDWCLESNDTSSILLYMD